MNIDRLSSQSSTPKIDMLYHNQTKLYESNNSTANIKNEQEQKPITKDKIEEVVNGMNQFLQPTQTSLKFVLHDKLNEYYVKVVDDKTHEVIREIPSKKLLDMYAAMTEFLGLVVDKKI